MFHALSQPKPNPAHTDIVGVNLSWFAVCLEEYVKPKLTFEPTVLSLARVTVEMPIFEDDIDKATYFSRVGRAKGLFGRFGLQGV